MTDLATANRNATFLSELAGSLEKAGFASPLTALPGEAGTSLGQRRTHVSESEAFGNLLLLEDDAGVLRFSDWGGLAPPGRRASTFVRVPGRIVSQRKFELLEPSKTTAFLQGLDQKLNPYLAEARHGLREFNGEGLAPATSLSGAGRALLVIHGTFSSSLPYFAPANPSPWMDFVNESRTRYDRVLAFDHATLAASPFLNAIELNQLFNGWRGDLDIVCHSRGGLVVRWWLEGLRPQGFGRTRVVFVGSPLVGTSLAAPARIRAALNLLTNVARTMCVISDLASFASPLFLAVSGLLRLVASLGPLSGKIPFLDAGVALVPGLSAQSRVENNLELDSLQRQADPAADYFAVTSNFEPEDPLWAFWKPFRLAKNAADHVFDGENDLVVDTGSMIRPGLDRVIPHERRLEYGTNGRVHHTNFFHQEETIGFMRAVLD